MKNVEKPLDPVEYSFWLPPEGMTLTTGESTEINVPQILLPIHVEDLENNLKPSEKAIGDGLNDYLRRFPDCPNGAEYAKILKTAYPFHVTNLGSEIIMLDVKQVEPEFVREKINMLKILALLDPENFGVLQRIGIAYYELALVYSELIHVRREMAAARLWLEKARKLKSDDLENLNYLAQICYFSGGYPQAKLYWRIIADQLEEGDSKKELLGRIERIENNQLPPHLLIDSLEGVGVALEHFNIEEYVEACNIMDQIEEEGSLPQELPNPEFFYFLGLCREKNSQPAGAFEAFSKVLEIAPQHKAAQEGIDRIQTTEKEA
jgi:tetratricopeptide (TPR) repeat protein